jgi:threonine synthase
MPAVFPWHVMRRRPPGLWRYREALPLQLDSPVVSLGEPETPLLRLRDDRYRLYAKVDYLFPTGSFKDRGAAVLMTKARELGITTVVEDSSGNAGAAIAAYAAAAGIQAHIYVPASAAPSKVAQIALYGATLVPVDGDRVATTKAAMAMAQSVYYASHAWNPFFLEGTKTVAFEIWSQLGERAPDVVITPVGHGTMLLGLAKGFAHLQRAGLIPCSPRIIGVQAAACAPLYQAFHDHADSLSPVQSLPTQAEGIAISQPLRWTQIMSAVRTSHGTILAVSEEEIQVSLRAWAQHGLLIEPTSATATAILDTAAGTKALERDATVVVVLTGSGNKLASWL